jgi:hypothetical protein
MPAAGLSFTFSVMESKLRWHTPLQGGCPTITPGNKRIPSFLILRSYLLSF